MLDMENNDGNEVPEAPTGEEEQSQPYIHTAAQPTLPESNEGQSTVVEPIVYRIPDIDPTQIETPLIDPVAVKKPIEDLNTDQYIFNPSSEHSSELEARHQPVKVSSQLHLPEFTSEEKLHSLALSSENDNSYFADDVDGKNEVKVVQGELTDVSLSSPIMSSQKISFEILFERFSKKGNKPNYDGKGISLENSNFWLKHARLIDEILITSKDAEELFNKFKVQTLDLETYVLFLKELAKKYKMEMVDVIAQLLRCTVPCEECQEIIEEIKKTEMRRKEMIEELKMADQIDPEGEESGPPL